MKKNMWSAALVGFVIACSVVGCAGSMASQEELDQLSSLQTEIGSLEQQKGSLERERATLAAAITDKENQLKEIENQKNQLR